MDSPQGQYRSQRHFQPFFSPAVFAAWQALQRLKKAQRHSVIIDGQNLDLASVVAVARHGIVPKLNHEADPELGERLEDSIRVLRTHLHHGWVVYGVNTGFGGSADSRTEKLRQLQVSLLQHTQSAIITSSDKDHRLIDGDGQSHVIPKAWVKGAILTRANHNVRGHSAVRIEVLETLLKLLEHDITPLVPLRGTISASGDLMPLSYIAGTVTGSADICVRLGPDCDNVHGRVVSAKEALAMHQIEPIELAPKEGLGLINGTAPSTALAALVMYEASQFALLAQVLTAFTAECLCGNVEWSHSFIHSIRPHEGQYEAAWNIRALLEGSDFVTGLGDNKKRTGEGLWQDRYSCRTAPQWLGPYLEDLALARRQIETELNSTCDNPVVDVNGGGPEGEVYSGGNFQATAITSAMDKVKSAVQMIGRMLFSQCTELINPALNNGLDANLVFGDPDASYTMKGIDVNMSAYMSELAALAHPVSSHVQSAEMHNQGINSLAFLSARRTMEAVDVLSHMCACHAYICCQAIDLRHYHRRFLEAHLPLTDLDWIYLRYPESEGEKTLKQNGEEMKGRKSEDLRREFVREQLQKELIQSWYELNRTSYMERSRRVASQLSSHARALSHNGRSSEYGTPSSHDIAKFESDLRENMSSWLSDSHNDPDPDPSHLNMTPREESGAQPSPMVRGVPGLGRGSNAMYSFVRDTLGVRFHRGLRGPGLVTVGSDVSRVYEAIKSERMVDELMPVLCDIWDPSCHGNGGVLNGV